MQPNTTLGGRYRLTSRIAGGGMGEVWKAHDTVLERTVAVKVIRADLAEDQGFAARFRGEARHAAMLSQSNIAQVHDYGADSGVDYLVMEYVEGTSLADLIDRGPMDINQTRDIISQAAKALDAAHEAGLVHRDVKPANILINRRGEVKLTDFGIARALGESKLTRTGEVVGTTQYLAPEAVLGNDATGAADIYSLAVVAYEMLAGRRPFVADSQISLAMMHVNNPPPPLPARVSPNVQAAIMHGLKKNPDDRPATATRFARELTGDADAPPLTYTPDAGMPQTTLDQRSMTPPPSSPAPAARASYPPQERNYRQPSYDQPVYQQPSYQQPSYRQPSYPPVSSQPQPIYQPVYQPQPQPINPQRPWNPRKVQALSALWLAFAAVVLVSQFMPWASLGSTTYDAFHLADAQYTYDPQATNAQSYGGAIAFLTVVIALLAIPGLLGKPRWWWTVPSIVLSFVAGMCWFASYGTIDGSSSTTPGVTSQLSTGSGLWLCLVAGWALVVTQIIVQAQRRRPRRRR